MRALRSCLWLALAGLTGAFGCSSSESAHSGLTEPIIVQNGQFFEGAFPADEHGPATMGINTMTNTVPAGTAGKKISGSVEATASSVALAFKDLGTGFWVVPIGPPDPSTGLLTWSATCDFSRDLPAGSHVLRVAASDSGGHFGMPFELSLRSVPRLPNGHVVASLTWGNDADLDLHLVGPSGKELDPKHPNTGLVDDAGVPAPGSGRLNRDSNANCMIDGYREEDVIWGPGGSGDAGVEVEAGSYLVRVDMFSACRQAATSFTFRLYVDGTPVMERSGILLDIDADGGGPGSGLFIGQFNCDGSGTCS